MKQDRKIVVGIAQGDANGIGYEVIIKALADERMLELCTPVIYGSPKIFGYYRKTLHNIEQIVTNVTVSADEIKPKSVNIINVLSDDVRVEPGQPSADSAKDAFTALERAVRDAKDGRIDVLVTAPFNKKVMQDGGFAFTGHTEYLQKSFDASEAVMMMVSDNIKVAVATQHIPLRDVPSALNADMLVRKLVLMKTSLERDFGISNPKIAVLGLNPHCGDGGLIGDEEQKIILPAIQQAQEQGIMAYGPYSSDGYFGFGDCYRFDATLAMYHDQGLAPFKALCFDSGVNFTAGLPIVRTSPDHGTAYQLTGRDQADPHSMIAAIYAAIDIHRKRAAYDELEKSHKVKDAPSE